MAGGTVPRADSILLVRAEYFKVLYSYGRRNDISAYSNSDRASRVKLRRRAMRRWTVQNATRIRSKN
jgi:hypothetical protein